MNSVPAPAMLVSTTLFNQSNITLSDGAFVKAIPINSGSILVQSAAEGSELAWKGPISESKIPFVKTSTKGRRPKSLAADMKPGFDVGSGMLTDRPMCRSCGKYFMSRQQLNQHMLVHTDVRKYKCTYCDRTFKQPSHLHQHHRIHTGEKPYRCPIPGCHRAFPQQSNLNHHLRNHDKPAPPPENTCSLCLRAYASETVLRSHISKIHMCDPDTLLGARKKSLTTSISQQQYVESIANVVSISSHNPNPENLFGTFSNILCDNNNVALKLGTKNPKGCGGKPFAATSPEAVWSQNESFLQSDLKYSRVQTNGNVSKSQVLDMSSLVNECNIEKDSPRESVSEKDVFKYTLDKLSDDLLNHFVPSTTSGRGTFDAVETDPKTNRNDGRVNNTEKELSSRTGISQLTSLPNVIDDEHNSDTKMSDESSSSHRSRSRKRKAFQPQRIVRNHEVNEEQEFVTF